MTGPGGAQRKCSAMDGDAIVERSDNAHVD
jgi:hypothetical protein